MIKDPKRHLLRHLLATVVFRAKVAISDAPENFAGFRLDSALRSPAEILAHIGDLLQGSHFLMKGEMVFINSTPLPWNEEVTRFLNAAKDFDSFLATNAELKQPIEKITQGPVGDALTHVGQLVMLRRAAGCPAKETAYFMAELVPGEF